MTYVDKLGPTFYRFSKTFFCSTENQIHQVKFENGRSRPNDLGVILVLQSSYSYTYNIYT